KLLLPICRDRNTDHEITVFSVELFTILRSLLGRTLIIFMFFATRVELALQSLHETCTERLLMLSLQQLDTGLSINLKAIWRVQKSAKLDVPLTGFEISLFDHTEQRMVELRKASITSPTQGILSLIQTVEFVTSFSESLDFGHDYLLELRFLPLGSNGSFTIPFSIPIYPSSGKCEMDSALARDNDKFVLFISEAIKFPLTSSVRISFYTAPPVFCFSEYTIEVHETRNPIGVYGKVIVAPTPSDEVVRHEFSDLPVDVYLSIKIYPTESFSDASQCLCSNCNCLVTQTKSFKFTIHVFNDSSSPSVSPLTVDSSSFFHDNLILLLLIPLLVLLIAMLALITRILKTAMKPQGENVRLISECYREERKPICSQELGSRSMLVIGLNSVEEHRFIHKLSSHLAPSTEILFAPHDLPDGMNKWKWMSDVTSSVHAILVLLREHSLSLYAMGSSPDPFDCLFLDQLLLLHPSDHRIITVTLDDTRPSLFSSSPIVYRDPRDFLLLTESLSHRGFILSSPHVPLFIPPLSPSLLTPPLTPPPLSSSLSPLISIRSESVSEESLSEDCGNSRKDSGFDSSSSSSLHKSPHHPLGGKIDGDIFIGYSLVAH
ncbi:hypothetical protein PMAYCL1PPCAC_02244, partial [Pristionchus mayeri]